MKSFLRIFILPLLCVTGGTLTAASAPVTPAEMAEATRWAAAKLQGQADTRPAAGFLLVGLENGSLGRNQIKERQLRIVDKVFEHGLHMPADGKVVVHLPAPGKTFEAVAGVDSNDVGYYDVKGRGTVIAKVDVAGKEVFRSQVLREGMEGVPV
jgi:hypothetical protein